MNACCLASLGDEGMASLGGGLVAGSQCVVPHLGMTRTVSVVAEEEGSPLPSVTTTLASLRVAPIAAMVQFSHRSLTAT